jgi:hypothetical protein
MINGTRCRKLRLFHCARILRQQTRRGTIQETKEQDDASTKAHKTSHDIEKMSFTTHNTCREGPGWLGRTHDPDIPEHTFV